MAVVDDVVAICVAAVLPFVDSADDGGVPAGAGGGVVVLGGCTCCGGARCWSKADAASCMAREAPLLLRSACAAWLMLLKPVLATVGERTTAGSKLVLAAASADMVAYV